VKSVGYDSREGLNATCEQPPRDGGPWLEKTRDKIRQAYHFADKLSSCHTVPQPTTNKFRHSTQMSVMSIHDRVLKHRTQYRPHRKFLYYLRCVHLSTHG